MSYGEMLLPLHMNEGIPLKELKKLKQDLKIYMQDCMLGEFCFLKKC
jgi:hypothetical protein